MNDHAQTAAEIPLFVTKEHVYAPVTRGFEVVFYGPESPLEGAKYGISPNGESGRFDGLYPFAVSEAYPAHTRIYPEFLAGWKGSWPVVVDIHGAHPEHTFGPASFTIHNPVTGLLPAVKAEWNHHPSQTVVIPDEGEVVTIAVPKFFDRNGAELPFSEPSVWQWSVDWAEPYEGVTKNKQIFYVSSRAKPGVIKLVGTESGGYVSYSSLTLV